MTESEFFALPLATWNMQLGTAFSKDKSLIRDEGPRRSSQLIASLSKLPVILMEPVSPYLRAACRYAFKTRSRAGSSRDDPEQGLFRAGS